MIAMDRRHNSIGQLLRFLIAMGIGLFFTACSSTNNNNDQFSINNYQTIPDAQLADFNVTLETSGEPKNSFPIKVAIFRQRETSTTSQQNKRLLVTSLNQTISIENSALLPPARFVRPHISLIYNAKQPIMRVSMLIGDYDATLNKPSPPMRMIEYEYEFINAYWQLSNYTDITHHTEQQGNNAVYINSEERIDLKNKVRTVKVQNKLTKTTFRYTQRILLANSLGYRVVIDTNKEEANVLLEKINFQ